MADSPHPGEPAGYGDRVHRGWPGLADADGVSAVLDLRFDPGTLDTMRVRTRACASRAGFPEDRVEDMVLAVHELAANAIVHGDGAGRLRMWRLARALLCQVDDGGRPGSDRPRASFGQAAVNALPCEPGHGLWVVRQVADQLQSISGPAGTSILIRFDYGTA
jgi:anti-sigma regulatory factor (Ser/Thr protein kinase)